MSVKNIVISRPCDKKWPDMVGDNRVRFCSQCNKDVHNLSDMSDRQIKDFVEGENGRVCVAVKQNADGSVASDNCPPALRPFRNTMRRYAVATLLTLSWSMEAEANAQNLVGAPTNTGQINLPGQTYDYAYSSALAITRVVTVIAIFIAIIVPIPEKRRVNTKLLALEIVCRLAIPVLTYLVGTFLANNFGGGGGCAVGGIDTGHSNSPD